MSTQFLDQAMVGENNCDIVVIVGGIFAFALPLTILIPGFSIWNVVPKFRITRMPVISVECSWCQLNAAITAMLLVFFCLYLEIRKRKLDDMVEKVLAVNQATDTTMEIERVRQAAAVKACVDLLDSSKEHYENLVLLRDEIRKREKIKQQRPPSIQLTSSEFNQ